MPSEVSPAQSLSLPNPNRGDLKLVSDGLTRSETALACL